MLFDLTHFGNFEYEAVYSMPTQFRMFYLKKLINVNQKERDDLDRAQGKMSGGSSQKVIKGPQIERR